VLIGLPTNTDNAHKMVAVVAVVTPKFPHALALVLYLCLNG